MTPGLPDRWTRSDVAAFWNRNPVERWVAFVVCGAALVTIAVIGVMYDLAYAQPGVGTRTSTVAGGTLGLIGAAAMIPAWWCTRYADISGWVRGAVVLVVIQLAVAISAWALWLTVHPVTWDAHERLPGVAEIPAPAIALGAIAAVWIAAAVDVRRRRAGVPPWLAALVVFALTGMLYLAIWLAVAVPVDASWLGNPEVTSLAPWLLGPPALAACVTAAVAVLRPSWLRPVVLPGATLLAIFLAGAVVRRLDAVESEAWIYGNFVHVLAALAVFALGAIAALAWTHASALRRNLADADRPAPWVQRGHVTGDGAAEPVAHLTVHGWLGGMRATTTGFTLTTTRGVVLPVPGGTPVVAPVPGWTASARHGERGALLVDGAPVIVTGYVEAAADGPFRTGGAPVPGPRGLVVTVPRRAHEPIGRDVILAIFRPCLLFLLISALAALPGLAGRGATQPDPPVPRFVN